MHLYKKTVGCKSTIKYQQTIYYMSTSGSEMKHVAHFVVAGLCLYGIKGYLFNYSRVRIWD